MKTKFRKAVCVIFMGALLTGTLAGCGSNDREGAKKLTYYTFLHDSTVVDNYGDCEAFKEINEKTGTDVEFQHPVKGGESEQFSVMLASQEYPDIIKWKWSWIDGGLSKMYSDGVAIRLNELIDEYAPNIKSVLDENPEIKQQVMLDDGTIIALPAALKKIDGKYNVNVVRGLIVRQDWLDKLGLEQPATIEEWEEVLRAFKERDPNGNGQQDEIPFSGRAESLEAFMGAFDMGTIEETDFYIDPDTGKIQYNILAPRFKEYITTMNRWYSEGLIDADYVTNTEAMFDANLTNDLAGSCDGWATAVIGKQMALKKDSGDGFKLAGVPYPADDAGRKVYPHKYSLVSDDLTIITSGCEDPVTAIKYLDYLYTEEGTDYLTYGIENVTYTKNEDGTKQYTDTILNDPEGMDPGNALTKYTPALRPFPRYSDESYALDMIQLPEQKQAQQIWSDIDLTLSMPLVSLTTEESAEFSSIMRDIDTYVEEMVTKIITGIESIDKVEEMQQQIEEMGIERAIEIQQTAYDRFNNRK